MHSFTIHGTDVSEDEAAAAMAAIACLLQEEAVPDTPHAPGQAGWRGSARLAVQGLAPARPPAAPTWGRIERIRRAGRGGPGIVGL